ncbi:MAG: flagellar FliJ family protein [Deltaproteobacteria bacterium]|nr:flagellar FliJ family protein [Deltaproteobacteria bacterium]
MKRFRFKLEVVLAERKRVEDLRLREWTLAKRILQGMMDALTVLELGLADAISKDSQLGSGPGVDGIGMFAAVDQFIAGQKTRIVWKTQEIERGARLTDKKRVEYVKARQKREALEKLKERRLGEHRVASHKHELKTLDDIYIMSGAARRRMDEEDEGVAV